PVLRNDGRPRHLQRRLDGQYESSPSALGDGRGSQPGSVEQRDLGTLRSHQGLDTVRRCRSKESEQGEGNGGDLQEGGRKVSGAAAGCFLRDARRRATPKHYRWPQ